MAPPTQQANGTPPAPTETRSSARLNGSASSTQQVAAASPAPAQISPELLTSIMTAVYERAQQPSSNSSMARCPVTYDGTRDATVINDFTSRSELFRDVERIPKADALKGLPLLLQGEAQTWWQGTKSSITSWDDALRQIHAAFAQKGQTTSYIRHCCPDGNQLARSRSHLWPGSVP